MRQRVLITGIAGFVGSHVAEHLSGEGYEVHGLVRRNPFDNLGDTMFVAAQRL